MKTILPILLVLCSFSPLVSSWDTEDFEIFDVVEEINKNFYEVMNISKDASLPEVKKAYRNLSRQLHPDKNDAPDADIQFRQMVSVYEILKDEGKRERYNKVLVEGIPDWRSALYYYRRARKMSMIEISIILIVVISITQYLMAWGSYWDKKHTLEDFLLRKLKIKDGKKQKQEDLENLEYIEKQLDTIEKPSWWRILPVQSVQLIIFLATNGPSIVKDIMQERKDEQRRQIEEIQRLKEEEERLLEEEERRKERKAESKMRKKVHKKKIPDYTGVENINNKTGEPRKIVASVEHIPVITGGPWTDEEFVDLTRLMNKFPGGVPERWEKIAAAMNRTTYEVIKISSRVKAGFGRPAQEEASVSKTKVKTKSDQEVLENNVGSDDLWSVSEQKALEKAMKKYPKGTEQRWDKIAQCLPDKNKEECMLRFKFLAEKIRKKKEPKDDQEERDETVDADQELKLQST